MLRFFFPNLSGFYYQFLTDIIFSTYQGTIFFNHSGVTFIYHFNIVQCALISRVFASAFPGLALHFLKSTALHEDYEPGNACNGSKSNGHELYEAINPGSMIFGFD